MLRSMSFFASVFMLAWSAGLALAPASARADEPGAAKTRSGNGGVTVLYGIRPYAVPPPISAQTRPDGAVTYYFPPASVLPFLAPYGYPPPYPAP